MSEDASAGHKADKVPEYHILLLGTAHKKPLFDKICEAAEKYEKHVQYNDTYYLHFTIDGQQCIVELSDPGVEHTGAREMAVRKADAVILSYAAHNATSFHKLTNIAEDFKLRKKYPPIVMISNEDEVLATDDEVPSTADSTSEGYGSDETLPHPHASEEELPGSPRRRPSMENIRNSLEDSPITSEQGETMAKLFGPECEFLSMRFSEYAEAGDLIKSMVRRIQTRSPARGRKASKSLAVLRRKSLPPLGLLSIKSGKEKRTHSDREEASTSSVGSPSPTTPAAESQNNLTDDGQDTLRDTAGNVESSNAPTSECAETIGEKKKGQKAVKHPSFAKTAAVKALKRVNGSSKSNVCAVM